MTEDQVRAHTRAQAQQLVALGEKLDAATATVADLRDTAKLERVAAEKDRKRRRRSNGLLIVAVLIVGFMVFLLLSGRSQTRGVIDRLNECTTAGTAERPHPCYDDGSARTADVVGQIIHEGARRQLEIEACDKAATTVAALRRCAAKALPDDLGH